MRVGLQQKINKLEKIAEFKVIQNVMILDVVNGKYYLKNREVDIHKIKARVVILNDIPR